MLWCHLLISAFCICWTDIREHKIRRNHIIVAIATFVPVISINALLHAGLNFLVFRFLYFSTYKAIGYGDVRLAFLIGLYSGSIFNSLAALAHVNVVSWISAGLFALVRLTQKEISSKKRIAFAPFMYLGLFVTYLAFE